MGNAIDIPPGTVFGRLTVIEEARTPGGRRAVLCQCECGKRRVVQLDNLRSGHTKSCGCFGREIVPEGMQVSRCEIPLYGGSARGRVALIDEDDHGLVGPYRWHVVERFRGEGLKPSGPYAQTSLPRPGDGSREKAIFMHVLIMGFTGIDHADGNGLNNRRSNLRAATNSQNAANTGPHNLRIAGASRFKGVYWSKRVNHWQSMIRVNGRGITLGFFSDEIRAAYAYDAAAREYFGEFARTNFQDGPTPAMQAQWQADGEAATAERKRRHAEAMSEWHRQREPETRICVICGAEYESMSMGPSRYCSQRCRAKAAWPTEQLRRQRLREQRQKDAAHCPDCGYLIGSPGHEITCGLRLFLTARRCHWS